MKTTQGKVEKNAFPCTVSYGSGRVRVSQRKNGWFSLAWREMGGTKKTTKSAKEKALDWAAKKARELDAGTCSRWIPAGEADALGTMKLLAGAEEGDLRRLVEDVRGALRWLEGKADLTTAARWYAEKGPLRVAQGTLRDAVRRFLAEYKKSPLATRKTFGGELEGFLAGPGASEMLLVDLSAETLGKWCQRRLRTGGDASVRSVDNRITTWITFLNRCRDWGLLAEGKHAADLLRRPVLPDAGREILTVDQGRKLLAAVREEDPALEGYLVIGGWLGLRPSEIQRLTWSAFDWERGYCHLCPKTAGKTSSERFVPMDARVGAILRGIMERGGRKPGQKVVRFRSREFLSVLARKAEVLEKWPADVLRHSFCSYRMAVVKSLDQVADEAGNSPQILKSNYRRPLREEDGLAWWALLDPPAHA